jgi:tRNA-2-methylthio-N6-dimethylallyladenosine synthase
MNQSDAERLSAVFHSLGYERTENESEADILGVVACSVRQKAIDKVYMRIHKWNLAKESRSILTFVTGCLLDEDKKKFLKLFDLVFPTEQINLLPELISTYGVVTGVSLQSSLPKDDGHGRIGDFWRIQPLYSSPFEAFVPIQNGCDKFCTYCAVPYTRGREVSRPSADIVAEVKSLVAGGCKAVTLLGQNVNSYGKDKKGGELTFAGLLEACAKAVEESGKKAWIYFTSPHPKDMTDDVLQTIAAHSSLAKWIHLPLQSGDDGILKKMNRNHTVDHYRGIVRIIRTILPQATLFTDIIVGFPSETREQFRHSMEAVAEFGFNMAYIAPYSPRPGARSADLDDDISLDEKKIRLHELTEVFKKSSTAWNKACVGKTMTALVTGHGRRPEYQEGRTEGYIPVRFLSDDKTLTGKMVELEITSSTELSLEGTLKRVIE